VSSNPNAISKVEEYLQTLRDTVLETFYLDLEDLIEQLAPNSSVKGVLEWKVDQNFLFEVEGGQTSFGGTVAQMYVDGKKCLRIQLEGITRPISEVTRAANLGWSYAVFRDECLLILRKRDLQWRNGEVWVNVNSKQWFDKVRELMGGQ
jgi:hypothetical protein